MDKVKLIVSIYTEATPNPESMKFVLNRMLLPQNSIDFRTPADAEGISPMASALFSDFQYVKGVFIMNNFVTITKTAELEWFEIIPELREYIRNYLAEEKPVVIAEAIEQYITSHPSGNPNLISENDSEIVKKIKGMLTKYVQPAVEMDGGSIVFRDFKDGIVTLGMQGSCSGCPSSTVTLKSGIEGLLKRMVPEVEEVVAEAL